jgi:hypothetical protein
MPMSQQQLSAKGGEMTELKAAERRAKALALRARGATYAVIAQLCDYASTGAAWNAVHSEYEKRMREPTEAAVKVEEERLDYYLTKLDPLISSGDAKQIIPAVATAVKVSERRAKLLGLDDNESRMAAAAERMAAVSEAQALMLATAMANLVNKLELPEDKLALAVQIVEAELKQITA